jgi:MFS family permease
MGVTMNHIAAVIAPLVGGVAWYYLGYQVIFFSGSVLAIISLIVSQKVNPESMRVREETVSRKIEVEV